MDDHLNQVHSHHQVPIHNRVGFESSYRKIGSRIAIGVFIVVCTLAGRELRAFDAVATPWLAGASKIDVTPSAPVRLSGYAVRSEPTSSVADPLAVRTLALTYRPEKGKATTLLLVAIDSIGTPGTFTQRVATTVEERWKIPRSNLVLCGSHSHTSPQLSGGLTNIFTVPMTEEQTEATAKYTEQLYQAVINGIEKAIGAQEEVDLEFGAGEASFAANRRVLANKQWTGFGVQEGGARDHSVPVLLAKRKDGSPAAIVFTYACHCTTMSPEINQISADWAGICSNALEKKFTGAVALATIGCGADMNPEPRGSVELAQLHGQTLADAVIKAISSKLKPLVVDKNAEADRPAVEAHFGFAGLAPERPSREQLEESLKSPDVHRQRWAKSMLDLWDKMGRIPETYPAPIHTWRIGNAITWVFLGGEVVVDYALRLKKELPGEQVWVSAYTDDVFAYVASERMRDEGGYEVDSSMIYYNQPGRWQSGTEELIVKRIHDILAESKGEDLPLSPEESLAALHVADDYQVQLVASEPLIQDPVNLAFDAKGRLWVVEMRDYPEGNGGKGGCVKILEDTDGNGVMDRSTIFLDGLAFPNGVFPWRDGAVISCAPEVFFARDTNGDGTADERKVLVTGFPLANPQHRVNGFSYGLDHRLHFTGGEGAAQVQLPVDGSEVAIGGRDLVLDVDAGKLTTETGTTQFIRSRDDWGNWFGNSNSFPMYHFVVDEEYATGASPPIEERIRQLFDPPITPPVFPSSRTVDRFNDLWTANRFTSACSAIVDRTGNSRLDSDGTIYVCEPVHNLVHRGRLVRNGSTYRVERFESEQDSEWLSSKDPWFRPVRVETGPDGAIWVVDMYRRVIEHTEWIPLSWQAQLNVRAGENLGRIYRVFPKSSKPTALPKVDGLDSDAIVSRLTNKNGAVRDLAQQQLLWRGVDREAAQRISKRLKDSDLTPAARLQSLATLRSAGQLSAVDIVAALQERDPRFLRQVIQWSEPFLAEPKVAQGVRSLLKEADDYYALQLVLTLGKFDPTAGESLSKFVGERIEDPWIRASIGVLNRSNQQLLLSNLVDQLKAGQLSEARRSAISDAVVRLILESKSTTEGKAVAEAFLKGIDFATTDDPLFLTVGAAYVQLFARENSEAWPNGLYDVASRADEFVLDSNRSPEARVLWSTWLGYLPEKKSVNLATAGRLLDSKEPVAVQLAGIDCLRRSADASVATILLGRWPGLTPEIRNQVSTLLLSREAWTESFLKSLESGEVAVNDLDASAIQALRSVDNRSLQARADQLFGRRAEGDRAEVVKRYLSHKSEPNQERGLALYRQHCAACHQPNGDASPIGASLSALTDRSPPALVTSILDPNKAVEAKFKQAVVATKDGQVLRGVVASESNEAITLGTSDGRRVIVPRDEIDEFKVLPISLMPEGFEKQLDEAAMADLVKFLQTADFTKL